MRVVAATNVDLKQAKAAGRFREDLYYRLGVITIPLPPLRERGEDILLLARTLLQRYAAESRHKVIGFSRQALSALQSYSWPGNVRELENRIKRAVLLTQGSQVTPADLDLDSQYSQYLAPGKGLREAREAFEKDLIQRALAKRGRPPRPEGRGFHAPGWLRCGPCGATPFPPRPERRGSSGVLDGGNISRTAAKLGVSRPTLHDLVTKYALER